MTARQSSTGVLRDVTIRLIVEKKPTRLGAPRRRHQCARGLVISLMLVSGSSLLLSSCVGHEEKLASGKTVRILRLYKDGGITASIPEAYGSALVVSFCVTGADKRLSNEALGILAFAADHAAAMSATTVVLDRHETPSLLLFGCGSARRSAYMHEGNNFGDNDGWYRVLPH